jgi:CRP-like cAMP-binding protein
VQRNIAVMNEALQSIIPPEKLEELVSISRKIFLKPKEYFIREGEVPKKFAFVFSGLFRYVYINNKGLEFTKGIIAEHQFISSYSAMISSKPSHFFIEALEDSEILQIPYDKWSVFLKDDIFWVKLLLKSVESGFIIKEKRERDLLLLNAETRCLNFLKDYPDMQHRISQSIIASYLGIQPESLSRIRKKISS